MNDSPAMQRAARATEEFWRRIQDEFGMLTEAEVGELIGSDSPAAALEEVGRKRREGLLLGVQRGQRVLYPGFQFDGNTGAPLRVIAQLRSIGSEFHRSEAGIVQWLCARTTYLGAGHGSRRPVDLLLADPDRILEIARKSWGIEW